MKYFGQPVEKEVGYGGRPLLHCPGSGKRRFGTVNQPSTGKIPSCPILGIGHTARPYELGRASERVYASPDCCETFESGTSRSSVKTK